MTLTSSLMNLLGFFLFCAPALALIMGRSRGVMAPDADELHRKERLDIDAFERLRDAYNRRAKVRLGVIFGSVGVFGLWAVVSSAMAHDEYHMLGVMIVGVLFTGAWVSMGLPFVLHDLDKLRYVNGHETSYVYAHGVYVSEDDALRT